VKRNSKPSSSNLASVSEVDVVDAVDVDGEEEAFRDEEDASVDMAMFWKTF
jgi:hypothetical protein